MSQEDSIKNILCLNKRDLYYNDGCDVVNLLNEVKAFGCIPKYQTWKKLFTYLTSSRYSVLSQNFAAIKIMLELIDEKYLPTDADLKKIFDSIRYNYDDKNKINDDIYEYLCNKFGICDIIHFKMLLKINDKKPINKFTTHVINYFNKNFTTKEYDFNNISKDIFLELIDNPNLRNILNDNIDKIIDKIIDKFDFTYSISYDYNMICRFLEDKSNLHDKSNLGEELDEEPKLKKKSKKSKNNKDDNDLDDNKDNKYTEKYIKDFYSFYTDLSKYIFDKSINSDSSETDKFNKKSKKQILIDENKDDEDYEDDKEKEIIKIYKQIYNLKFKIKVEEFDYYFYQNYVDKDNLIKTLDEFEIKLKSKLTFINSSLYTHIDSLEDNHNSYSYDSEESTRKKYEEVYNYIPETIEENIDEWDSDKEEYIPVKKSYIKYNAIPKQSFIKYLFEMCPNREHINENNIKDFIDLKNINEFIQFTDSDNSVKKLLKEVYDNKILSLEYFKELKNTDLEMLLKLNFDNITMRNAILKMNVKIIEFLFDNKYCGSQNDILYIRHKICDTNNKKQDYYNSDNNYTYFDEIAKILDVFAKYNIYMDKDVLNKFCIQNDFHEKFDYMSLQKYTIYKDESEKEFKQIINDLGKFDSKFSNKFSNKLGNICDIQIYIDDIKKSGKTIDKNDLYNFADYKMKFILDEYFKNNDITKIKKIIVKKIVKKVVKKE